MPLAVVCDEHTPYEIRNGLIARGIDAVSVQEIGLRSADDKLILATALELGRVVYTSDDDYLRLDAPVSLMRESSSIMLSSIPSEKL